MERRKCGLREEGRVGSWREGGKYEDELGRGGGGSGGKGGSIGSSKEEG